MNPDSSRPLNESDPAEIAKFEAAAHRFWDVDGEFKALHKLNPVRARYVAERVTLRGARVLDVGCGGGILAEAMARRGARVSGIDLSEKALRVATLHLLESGLAIDYQAIGAEDYAERHAGAFDVVTCMELLEHVPEPSSMVAACAKLVRPGGQVYFSTINRNPKAYVFAVIGAEYVLGLLPKGTHDYARFIKPSELARWSREADLRVEEMIGMTYNPLTKHYRLEDDCSVNYLVRCLRD